MSKKDILTNCGWEGPHTISNGYNQENGKPVSLDVYTKGDGIKEAPEVFSVIREGEKELYGSDNQQTSLNLWGKITGKGQ